jgi:hypothetical protein
MVKSLKKNSFQKTFHQYNRGVQDEEFRYINIYKKRQKTFLGVGLLSCSHLVLYTIWTKIRRLRKKHITHISHHYICNAQPLLYLHFLWLTSFCLLLYCHTFTKKCINARVYEPKIISSDKKKCFFSFTK